LVAALVAIPSLIDANAYKPQIIAQMKRATGRDVTIEGPVRLSLLPVPGVSFDGLRVSNVSAAKSPNMVKAKSVSVSLSLLGLLTGELRPAEVTLFEPRIILEIDASGRPNWLFPATPDASVVSLSRLVIENGTVTFRDARSGLSFVVSKAAFLASAGSVDGPFSLAGEATVNNVPTSFDLVAGVLPMASGLDVGKPGIVAAEHTCDLGLLSTPPGSVDRKSKEPAASRRYRYRPLRFFPMLR
jgi:uncharacterized protein involved in outer membrane biogenesis